METAVSHIQSKIKVLGNELLDISDSNGRISARDVMALYDMPPFDRSPLDGYAVKASDTRGASRQAPVRLNVIDEVFAGNCSDKTLSNGEAVRIMTGAPMPDGSDCVVMQENTDYGEDTVCIFKEHSRHQNYCFMGEDIKKGGLVMKKGSKIRAAHQGILASVGVREIEAVKKPRVTLIITGSELVPLGSPLEKGKIYNSNLYLIKNRLAELSAAPAIVCMASDDSAALAGKIREFLPLSDIIITTGGVSVGKKDILYETLDALGAEIVFKGANHKPGPPAIFSMADDTPVISLSGNPSAAIITFELLARPALFKMTQDPVFETRRVKGILKSGFCKKSDMRRFVRAVYSDGEVYIPGHDDAAKHSSGAIGSMIDCNCLVDVKSGDIASGDTVDVVML